MVSLEQACRENGCIVYCICVNRTIYIFLINGQRLAYINETIGLVLVLQTILPTTIGASVQDYILSTGGGRIGLKRKNFHRTQESERNIDFMYIYIRLYNEK